MFGNHKNRELEKIKDEIKRCGTKSIHMLESVNSAFFNDEVKLCDVVIDEMEPEMNQFDVDIELQCVRYLALYSPKAKDLRTVITYLEIIHELERIGDLCTGIAKSIKLNRKESFNPELSFFKEIFSKTLSMLINSNKCVHNEDVFEAMTVINSDKEINESYYAITQKVMEIFKKNPKKNVEIYELLKMMQRLERIGDHSKNIAEEIVYLVEGRVIRH